MPGVGFIVMAGWRYAREGKRGAVGVCGGIVTTTLTKMVAISVSTATFTTSSSNCVLGTAGRSSGSSSGSLIVTVRKDMDSVSPTGVPSAGTVSTAHNMCRALISFSRGRRLANGLTRS